MDDVLAALLKLLQPEEVADDHFLGQSRDLGFAQVFGGQVLGQALNAASRTVQPGWLVHSLHGYFLRRGAVDTPILYEVDRIRDGRSFATRRVVASQDRKAIFSLAASFQLVEEGFEHQSTMPEVRGPEGLLTDLELARRTAGRLPERVRELWTRERPLEFRVVERINYFDPKPMDPLRHAWVKAVGALPDDPILQRCLLAYASDFQLLGACLQPHAKSFLSPDMQVASLDHALWIHRSFRLDDWLLYAIESPSASGGRGFNRASYFDRAGRLVASVAQEGLIRYRGT